MNQGEAAAHGRNGAAPKASAIQATALLEEQVDRWNRGDVRAMAGSYAQQAVVDFSMFLPGDGVCSGQRQIAELYETLWDVSGGAELRVAEIHNGGPAYVAVVELRANGGRARRVALFYRLSGVGSSILEARVYRDLDEALRAARAESEAAARSDLVS
jgi:hypothetical protein